MDLLDLHQRRREKGTPTVSLLVGPLGLGLSRWKRWATDRSAVLWIAPPGEGRVPELLRKALPLVEATPAVPFAIAVGAREARALREGPPTRAATLAREGWVELLRAEVACVHEETYAEAHAEELSEARSAAEQLLYDLLAAHPETAGLFALNVRLDFLHGNAPAEADLFARSLRLVIEVDGSYFHLHPEQYRRDRRKDWLLQQHGYPTLRFLAEDVVGRQGEVLSTILAAVRGLGARR